MTISSLIIFFLILFMLVVVHEFGHFIFAKWMKMRVDEFAFGFPPKLYSKKIGETVYSFNMIPLGGYVKIYGENGLDEEELKKVSKDESDKTFSSKSVWARLLVLCGGVMFNLLAAIILFTIVFINGSYEGLSSEQVKITPANKRELVINSINPKSQLARQNINPGASIVSFSSDKNILEGENLSASTASQFVQDNNNSNIEIKYIDKITKQVGAISALAIPGIVDGKKVLGVSFADVAFKKYPLHLAIIEAVKNTYYQTVFIFSSLITLVHDLIYKNAKLEDSVSGPVGLAILTAKISTQGLEQILGFAAMLSISLAVFNILPIPALDGGRVVFVLIEAITKRKVSVKVEQIFHTTGFLLLMALMLFVTYFDIAKAFVK